MAKGGRWGKGGGAGGAPTKYVQVNVKAVSQLQDEIDAKANSIRSQVRNAG